MAAFSRTAHRCGQSAAHTLAQAATGFARGELKTHVREGRGLLVSAPQRTNWDSQLHLSATRMEGALANASSAITSRERSSLMPLGFSNMSSPHEREVTTDNLAPAPPALFPSQLSLPQPSQWTPEKRARHPVRATGDVRLHTEPKQLLSSFPRHRHRAGA